MWLCFCFLIILVIRYTSDSDPGWEQSHTSVTLNLQSYTVSEYGSDFCSKVIGVWLENAKGGLWLSVTEILFQDINQEQIANAYSYLDVQKARCEHAQNSLDEL